MTYFYVFFSNICCDNLLYEWLLGRDILVSFVSNRCFIISNSLVVLCFVNFCFGILSFICYKSMSHICSLYLWSFLLLSTWFRIDESCLLFDSCSHFCCLLSLSIVGIVLLPDVKYFYSVDLLGYAMLKVRYTFQLIVIIII